MVIFFNNEIQRKQILLKKAQTANIGFSSNEEELSTRQTDMSRPYSTMLEKQRAVREHYIRTHRATDASTTATTPLRPELDNSAPLKPPRCWFCDLPCTRLGWAGAPTAIDNVSWLTLCSTCVVAVSLPPGTSIQEVSSHAASTFAGRGRSPSFIAFLREYKALLEFLGRTHLSSSSSAAKNRTTATLTTNQHTPRRSTSLTLSSASPPRISSSRLLLDSTKDEALHIVTRLLDCIDATALAEGHGEDLGGRGGGGSLLTSTERVLLLAESEQLRRQVELVVRQLEMADLARDREEIFRNSNGNHHRNDRLSLRIIATGNHHETSYEAASTNLDLANPTTTPNGQQRAGSSRRLDTPLSSLMSKQQQRHQEGSHRAPLSSTVPDKGSHDRLSLSSSHRNPVTLAPPQHSQGGEPVRHRTPQVTFRNEHKSTLPALTLPWDDRTLEQYFHGEGDLKLERPSAPPQSNPTAAAKRDRETSPIEIAMDEDEEDDAEERQRDDDGTSIDVASDGEVAQGIQSMEPHHSHHRNHPPPVHGERSNHKRGVEGSSTTTIAFQQQLQSLQQAQDQHRQKWEEERRALIQRQLEGDSEVKALHKECASLQSVLWEQQRVSNEQAEREKQWEHRYELSVRYATWMNQATQERMRIADMKVSLLVEATAAVAARVRDVAAATTLLAAHAQQQRAVVDQALGRSTANQSNVVDLPAQHPQRVAEEW